MEITKPKMIYRKLGNSGLDVSILSYGSWLTAHDPESETAIMDCVKKAHELGVNFFDTAEVYGAGVAETIFGKALKALDVQREDLVISTKIMRCGSGPNDSMLSRKHIIEGLRNSLERLQLEYVDVVFCHRPDTHTNITETCRAMDWVVEEGLAFYWATSEWTPADIAKAHEICEKEGLNKPIADQCQYSALWRENFEKNLRHSFENYKYGTTIWSPLAMGLLSGKYNDGEFPEGSRFKTSDYARDTLLHWYFGKGDAKKEETVKILQGIGEIAKDIGCSQAQLALAWTLVNKDVSTCIFGATKVSQVEDNLKSLEVAANWTKELEERFEKVLKNQPEPEMDFNVFAPKTPRRLVALDLNIPHIEK